MPRPSTGPKMFWACPNILCRTKKYFAFIATPKNFVLALKLNLIMPCPFTGPKMFWADPNFLCQTKKFAFSKIVFCAGTKVFEEALNAVIFLGWLKKFWDL